MNNLLGNEEAENGVNPNSEDLDAEDDDGPVISIINRSISALIRSPLNYRSNRAPLWNVMRPGKDTGCILT